MSSLAGRVALVTGSSRGIGAAVAAELAERGAKVAVHGDVTRFADVEAMRRRIEETLGPVDVLVANAGGNLTPPAPLGDASAR